MEMAMPAWDPQQYARYSGERSRPFLELIARIDHAEPASVVDLGCGNGELTAILAGRWPRAEIVGIDSSPDMLAKAPTRPGLEFALGDIAEWRADRPIDVIVSNAALQWVSGHLDLLPGFIDALTAGGIFAFQVPGNFGMPSHTILAELRQSPRWRDKLGGDAVLAGSREPAEYLARLAGLGCSVDAWETTYLHVLPGEDAVLEWVKGSALRPVFDRLDAAESAEFLEQYGAALRAVYPKREYGTVFPFRRIFAVARKTG